MTPPGVDPAHQRVRSAAVVLPPDQPFKDGAREAMIARPGVAPASVCRASRSTGLGFAVPEVTSGAMWAG